MTDRLQSFWTQRSWPDRTGWRPVCRKTLKKDSNFCPQVIQSFLKSRVPGGGRETFARIGRSASSAPNMNKSGNARPPGFFIMLFDFANYWRIFMKLFIMLLTKLFMRLYIVLFQEFFPRPAASAMFRISSIEEAKWIRARPSGMSSSHAAMRSNISRRGS